MAIASCKTKACIDGEFGAPLKISMGFASWQHYYTTTLTCCHRSSPSYSIGLCHLAFALWMKSNSMLPKRKCCGALTRDDSNNYQKSHFALAATRCSLYDIYIDNGLTMNTHVSKTVASCFAALRRISSIQRSVTRPVLFMVALCNRADHYIFILFLSSFFLLLLFFPRLISAVGDWMFTILWHMVWP